MWVGWLVGWWVTSKPCPNACTSPNDRCAQPTLCLFVVLPDNAIGDEGATALAGALGQLKQLTEFYIDSTCVLRWYALVIGSGMPVPVVLIVVVVVV